MAEPSQDAERAEAELARAKRAFFNQDGTLRSIPSKQGKKDGVLQLVVQSFDKDVSYTEKEVNERLKALYADYATLRRDLIDGGYLKRTDDGKSYWRVK